MQVVAAGAPALGTMLAIAGIALLLGLISLWLARRHTHRERRDAKHPQSADGEQQNGPGAAG